MICAIILAAGNSSRFYSKAPKQFQKLNGRLVIDYSIQTFLSCKDINKIIIVVPNKYIKIIKKLYPLCNVVSGGDTRRESSYNGLIACPNNTEKVLIHDAARIFIDNLIIKRCLNGLERADAISTVISAKDTLVKVNNKIVIEIPDRNQMYIEQTPQAFRYKTILEAHKNILINVTDDIKLTKEAGVQCMIVHGSEKNFKITTIQDFKIAEILLKEKR